MSTLFLGFGTPTGSGALYYLQCLKDITYKILPWEEFFPLVSSIVTDGENINIGRLNGICQKLKMERTNALQPQLLLFSIWCVAHRINLAWKAVCKIDIIASIIIHTSKLSTYFHNSAVRTRKLNDIAASNHFTTPLRYPKYFAVRWTEFVFNLFNAVLRNWRASITYFESVRVATRKNLWCRYNVLHLLTFLTDMLSLLKPFQKSCQSNSVSIFDVFQKKDGLIERLESCRTTSLSGGWEELFLKKVINNRNGSFLYGVKLTRSSAPSNRRRSGLFTPYKRQQIIQKLIGHLNIRLNSDTSLQDTLKPLDKINSSTLQHELKLCHSFIVPDLDDNKFYAEYCMSADLLKDCGCDSAFASLQKLQEISPDELPTIKYALARIVAAKPHSADVERLINIYNKFKDADRASLSRETLWNYLYVNTNLNSLEEFDPTAAAQYWMEQKKKKT